MLTEKRVVVGVTGGIAAYKAAALTSQLVQAGAKVKVVMTESAKEFVTPLTFQALSRQPVYENTFIEPNPEKIAHIDVADWADVIVLAPATANVIAKLANGIGDDMLTTMLLATKAPVYVAPAMNVNMYDHPAVTRNVTTLVEDGYTIIDGNEGYLACGWVGKGRMAEPETIVSVLKDHFQKKERHLAGKKILITAGPTQERIDPVRYFTNHSSGKMGYALAKAAKERGGEVILVSGQTALQAPKGVKRISITSAKEMYDNVIEYFDDVDIVIKAAAVADYRPKETYDNKRKKGEGTWFIEMERTKDILKTLGKKKQNQLLVGFAAETENVEENAMRKLKEKNLDLIVANDISASGAGFKEDTNIVSIVSKDEKVTRYPLLLKDEVAMKIIDEIIALGTNNR